MFGVNTYRINFKVQTKKTWMEEINGILVA